MVGKAHIAVLKAAFICDIVRCGTYAVGARHEPRRIQGPVPRARRPRSTSTTRRATSIQTNTTEAASTVARRSNDERAVPVRSVQHWFFTQQAENLKDWKNSFDGYGNSLLDYTVVPYVTEVRATQHERNNMPGMIIGGKLLGFAHNLYNTTGSFTLTSSGAPSRQAFGYTGTGGPFARANRQDLWTKPA